MKKDLNGKENKEKNEEMLVYIDSNMKKDLN